MEILIVQLLNPIFFIIGVLVLVNKLNKCAKENLELEARNIEMQKSSKEKEEELREVIIDLEHKILSITGDKNPFIISESK